MTSARTVRLRAWQKAALDAFRAADGTDFLAVATPGAGKTTFALTAARSELADHPGQVLVVAPTAHLKVQWATAAHAFGLHLDPSWSPTDGPLAGDLHGIVTTYQQVASSAAHLRAVADGAFVVFDEIHHAADDRAWGDSIRHACAGARRRLSLSGTPFRSDTAAIPFINYVADEAVADYTYGYGDALRDGRVVRPVYFPRTGGEMEWIAPDGSQLAATFDDDLDAARAAQRLRTALSLEGQWLPTVLRNAHDRLTELRRDDPDSGGLVIAIDREHARGIAEMMSWRLGVDPVVVTSDDPAASAKIARFAGGRDPWLVAVRMVSEGVDIPRLSVGVFATTTTTELFFRQAVGRLVRWRRGGTRQQAFFFLPDDSRLRARAFQIADERRHSLRRRDDDAADDRPPADEAAFDEVRPEQLSLFAAVSAVATGHSGLDDSASPPWTTDAAIDGGDDADDDGGFEIALGDPPPLTAPSAGSTSTMTRAEQKRRLREFNAEAARELALVTGWEHRRVNAELNRLSGVQRVAQATAEQLERRLRAAEAWLRRA